jgi:hypothetical protein
MHNRKATYDELRAYDIVLTTYGTVAQEWKQFQQHLESNPGVKPEDDAVLAMKCPLRRRGRRRR